MQRNLKGSLEYPSPAPGSVNIHCRTIAKPGNWLWYTQELIQILLVINALTDMRFLENGVLPNSSVLKDWLIKLQLNIQNSLIRIIHQEQTVFALCQALVHLLFILYSQYPMNR